MRTQMLLLAAVVCTLGVTSMHIGAQPGTGKKPGLPGEFNVKPRLTEPIPVRWEYHLRSGHASQVDLNNLGNEGWELVAIEPGVQSRGFVPTYVFKRPATGKPKADDKPDAKPAPVPAPKETESVKLELRTYHLKHANAQDIAQLLGVVLRINKHLMEIAAEPRTNQIVVNGSIEAHADIIGLLERLDVPAANDASAPGSGPGPVLPKKKK